MRSSKRRRSAHPWEQQAYDGAKKRYKYPDDQSVFGARGKQAPGRFRAEADEGRAPDAPAKADSGGRGRETDPGR